MMLIPIVNSGISFVLNAFLLGLDIVLKEQ